MKITILAEVRPNFIKVAPIIHAIQRQREAGVDIRFRLIHSGQHFDDVMTGAFFDQLNSPIPEDNLENGGGSQAC
jgi:UDP-N-acetylglucosamine 2-epimerase (non-hydrolysing)